MSLPPGSQPAGLPDPSERHLRIGTPEREAAAARLSAALSEGRLELDEYDERMQLVYAAKTYAELVPITADLPAERPADPPGPNLFARLRPAERTWVFVAVLLISIWALQALKEEGDLNDFWFVWPVGILGAIVLADRFRRS